MKRQERGFLSHEPDFEEEQHQALELCEVALSNGLRQQLEGSVLVGAQLARIREQELYRVVGCETFELYYHKVLSMTRDQVRRYLDAYEIVETIRAADLELPANETQAVMLGKIPRSRLIACWREVLGLCAREEIALSDSVVRRAVRFEIAREKRAAPSESVAQKRAEKSRAGVKVTLEA